GWRVVRELACRADGARHEAAAAIGAGALERALCAVGAESAFKTADHGVERGWREVLIAALTVWSEFEHRVTVSAGGRSRVSCRRARWLRPVRPDSLSRC